MRHLLLISRQAERRNYQQLCHTLRQLPKGSEFNSASADQSEMLLTALEDGFNSDSPGQEILETIDFLFGQALSGANSLELTYDNSC